MKIIRHKYILLFVITNTIAYIRTAKDKKQWVYITAIINKMRIIQTRLTPTVGCIFVFPFLSESISACGFRQITNARQVLPL